MSKSPSLYYILSLKGEKFVNECFESLLGRNVDVYGLRFYLSKLALGYSKRSVLAQIASSPERVKREEVLLAIEDDHAFVFALYRAYLFRDPDNEGLEYFQRKLNEGISKADIVAEIKLSQEADSVRRDREFFEEEISKLVIAERKGVNWFVIWPRKNMYIYRQLAYLEQSIDALIDCNLRTSNKLEFSDKKLEDYKFFHQLVEDDSLTGRAKTFLRAFIMNGR